MREMQPPYIVSATISKIYHITDQERNGATVRTRCGRTLASYNTFRDPIAPAKICPKCGNAADFDAVNDQRRAEYATAEAENERRIQAARKITAERRELRAQTMEQIVSALEQAGIAHEFATASLNGIDQATAKVNGVRVVIEVKTDYASVIMAQS